MILNLFALRDLKMGCFMNPFVARNNVDASRQIKAALEDKQLANTPLALAPGDFEIHHIGTFDDVDGIVTNNAGSTLVCACNSLVAQLPS